MGSRILARPFLLADDERHHFAAVDPYCAPPLANVLLDLIKASSLAAMITVPELLQHAKIIGGREFDYMTMYILTALIYWAICSIAAAFQNILEKKYAHYV